MSEHMDGAGPAGPALFVPDTDRAQLPGPFALEPYGAYGRYLASIDPGGLWRKQLQPGETGFGMFVAFHDMFVCCHKPGGYLASQTRPDEQGRSVPLLFPAAVEWVSVIDPVTHRVYDDVARDYEEHLDFPPVGVVGGWWLDDARIMPWSNLIPSDDSEGPETWSYQSGPGVVMQGLAAPWQILPLSEKAYRVLSEYLAWAGERYATHVLGYTNCEMNEDDFTEDQLEDRIAEHEERCSYTLGASICSCGNPPTVAQTWDALLGPLTDGIVTPGDLFVPQVLAPAWDLALRNYVLALDTIHGRAFTLGDTWSSFCWQRLSPFSGSRLPAEQALPLLSRSTSSVTPQGSSPGSSPQLTLFAS